LRSSHPGIPVVVVGNITVGGSGKTPLVLWIAEFLKGHGWSPAIVSRRHGGLDAGGGRRRAGRACAAQRLPGVDRRRPGEGGRGAAPAAPRGGRRRARRRSAALSPAPRPRDRGGGFARLRQRMAPSRGPLARAAAAPAVGRCGRSPRYAPKRELECEDL